MYFKQIIFMNRFKFKDTLVLPLKNLIEKIYGKKVDFNLVILKSHYLNSDILTQIITLKTKNRRNRVLRVLKASLRKVKIPYENKISISREKPKLIGVQNLILSDIIKNESELITLNEYERVNNDNLGLIISKNNKAAENNLLNYIKHKNIKGVKVQASGRITRRMIAARAVLKFKYVGSLKNVDSSYRGLSTVMLRGNQKSNIQYSKLKSKTRIGAFGIKGWVNSN